MKTQNINETAEYILRLSDKMQSLHLGTKQQTVAVWLS